jgi:transcriptional regulator with XRE-family HTH domain
MNSNSKLPEIRKEAFIKARENLGLSTKQLGGMACLSTRQIEQIENGETSSFYGAQIKVTAAKKVAKLLKLSEVDAFNDGAQAPQKFTASQVELPIGEAKLVKNPQDDEVEKMSVSKKDAAKDAIEIKEQAEQTQLPTMVIAEEKKEPITKVHAKEAPFTGTASKSKPASQKKLFLWLSVIAAAVFAVINLRPLFFADKPQEIILVKEEVIEPAPPPAVTPVEPAPAVAPASVIAADIPGACPPEEGIVSYKPEIARKSGDMVYVQTKSQQVICVVDASGKTQNKLIEPGLGSSFYGKPPFKVLTAGLNQVDIYFQGAKVRLSDLNTKTLILEASIVTAPSTDQQESQPRQP